MQLNKNIKIFLNYFLGPLVFVWLLTSIYQQIVQQPHLGASWQYIKEALGSYKIISLLLVILFMAVNWGLEAQKWKVAVATVYPVPFLQAFKATLSGVSFSTTLPNRVGDYAGRMLYLPDGYRLQAVSVVFVGSLAQVLITLLSGVVGLVILKEDLLGAHLVSKGVYEAFLGGIVASLAALTILYFNAASIGNWLGRWLKNGRYGRLLQALMAFDMQRLWHLLLLSLLRYTVFVVQYFLLFSLFGVHVPAAVVWCVMSLVFLALAIIPSITLVEVGLRGSVSLQLMGLFTANNLGILLTSVTVWFINLIVPALVGSILILRIKVFKSKNETI